MNRRLLILAALCGLLAPPLVSSAAEAKVYKIGVTPGVHEQTMEFVKPLLAKKGIEIEIVSFSDYVLPNQAVNDGDLDMNAFQHKPYFDNQVKDRGYKLVSAGTNFLAPMGIYSKKIKSLDELKKGDSVGIPNDPTNGGRALLLLQKHGLIKLDGANILTPGVPDIAANPRGIKIVELDAAQMPRALEDLAAGAVNTNYAVQAGFLPTRDAVVLEAADSPYVNIFAVRAADKDAPWVKEIVSTYQSEPVRQFILKEFKGSLVPAF
ncbi:DL-methionine transporter subunit; periplasmic-binding component of ABC superfamily [uncultured Alphaproteobacteria bacterium]|uniref:DL-methionine transporter subunit periplasmic-binding component of ABC superfamily n=1 Tax=uncultured Alphaproteobacteria bacterium TaxID=91750 RepID=A0A212KM99_9PROT|nr:DL-methionine transporter subunit; periplasmic-binding component of ABC superfamily [uncultured Alphaproteobacteria bacterium]